jgi:hypothetical protein
MAIDHDVLSPRYSQHDATSELSASQTGEVENFQFEPEFGCPEGTLPLACPTG